MLRRSCFLAQVVAISSFACIPVGLAQTDRLPAWNDGPAKQSIVNMKNDWNILHPFGRR